MGAAYSLGGERQRNSGEKLTRCPARCPACETCVSPYAVARFTGRTPQALCYSLLRRL